MSESDSYLLIQDDPPLTKEELDQYKFLKDRLKKVQDYILELTNHQIGYGDDPIQFLIASHAWISAQFKLLREQVCTVNGEVCKKCEWELMMQLNEFELPEKFGRCEIHKGLK